MYLNSNRIKKNMNMGNLKFILKNLETKRPQVHAAYKPQKFTLEKQIVMCMAS
jgi:hypothetical protein